jgi:acetamidase/formamidase
MAVHHLELEQRSLHGYFDRDLPPVLTIEPGDSVVCRTLDASWTEMSRRFGEEMPDIDAGPEIAVGHALSGPVAVLGAEPGDALAVEVVRLVPLHWGWTWSGPRPWNAQFGLGVEDDAGLRWLIDSTAGTATDRNELGLTLKIAPFMGIMGNAPASPGRHSTIPPRRVGGNLDCRELIEGSTVLLPVEVEGAIFSVGDGHAAQGDGEVGQTAIECGMRHVELRFRVIKKLDLTAPQAVTPAGYVTLGLGESLDEAAACALNPMLGILQSAVGLTRGQAMALASLVVSLRVTQVVNGGRVGVHAVLRPDAPGCREACLRVR